MPRNKYRNDPVTHPKHGKFDSRGEMRRYCELELLQKAGEISHLKRQVTLNLQGLRGPVKYASGRQARVVVDFAYRENGVQVYEDFKGVQTQMSKLQHAVLAAQGIGIRISK